MARLRAASRVFAAAVAGGLIAGSVPPAGWWPLGMVGIALLAWCLRDQSARARLGLGLAAGAVQFVITLLWIEAFTATGFVLLVMLEASFVAAACVLAGPRSALALAPALVLAESFRAVWPFGGLPMGGIALGQAAGPLAPAARVGGPLLVVGLTAALGAGLVLRGEAPTRIARGVLVALLVAAVLGGSRLAPDGGRDAVHGVRVAAVQGGGERGFTKAEVDPADVLARHLEASERIRPPVDLVLWPEDVIDVEGRIDGNPEARLVADLARRVGAPVVAGVVEGAGPTRFRNAAVVWDAGGTIIGRYEKVHRVPFGEWVPFRSFFDRFADLSAVPRDAIPGEGRGVVGVPLARAGRSEPLGVLISYEVFDAARARSAVRARGSALLVPTNTASYRGTYVQEQEIAAARLRAIETGRWLVQASPTGHALIVTPEGRVAARTGLDEQAVLHGVFHSRNGRTVYTRIGDLPLLGAAVLLLLVLRGLGRRADRYRASGPDGQGAA